MSVLPSTKKNSGADTELGGRDNEIFAENAEYELPVGHLKKDVPWTVIY